MNKFITVDLFAIDFEEAELVVNALTIAFINENDQETCEKYIKICQDWEEIRDGLAWNKMAVLEITK